ncbi:hypothetical protein KW790_02050 [Candidatus Parcubacteria bacterium]|nr:hypothetical protein [Candidatus Parcubacteria bacterium]
MKKDPDRAPTVREQLEAELKDYEERLKNNKRGAPVRRKFQSIIDDIKYRLTMLKRLEHAA